MAPTKDDWISLEPEKGREAGGTGLNLHVRHPPEAREALDKARDDLTSILDRAGLRPRVRTWHVEPVGNSRHYGGSCRMHAKPEYGMIDGWNRIYDVPNVAVVDSSAFTTGPEKNPVLTAMAISARASDRLATELRAGDL
jgi:choline dehydrogenase-like flavoprotein